MDPASVYEQAARAVAEAAQWVEGFTPDGIPFYTHRVTRERTWTRPVLPPVPMLPRPQLGRPMPPPMPLPPGLLGPYPGTAPAAAAVAAPPAPPKEAKEKAVSTYDGRTGRGRACTLTLRGGRWGRG
jgi:hypothetical protein